MYAVDGEVPIDLSLVAGNPHGTMQKAEAIQRATLAPAEPSGQDRQVAAKAAALVTKARQELAQQSQEITNIGKKVGQKQVAFYLGEILVPPSNTQARQEISPSSLPDFSSYSQEKQRHSDLLTGSIVNVYA